MGFWGLLFLIGFIVAVVQLKKHFLPGKINFNKATALSKFTGPLYWIWDDGFDDTVLKETGKKRQIIDTDDVHFPKNFLWGTATGSFFVSTWCNFLSSIPQLHTKLKAISTIPIGPSGRNS